MSLILRLDVDKPYGRATFFSKVKSKLRENFYFPAWHSAGFLGSFWSFIDLLKTENIPAHVYFRLNTLPANSDLQRLPSSQFSIGLHAEDTRSKDTFAREVDCFRKSVPNLHSFTKHGSGKLKLGRRHYPPYEQENYRAWAIQLGVPFLFGNGVGATASEFAEYHGFFPRMFWIDSGYGDPSKQSVEGLVEIAKKTDAVIIVHPENFFADPKMHDDFLKLIRQARENGVQWKRFHV